MDKMKKILLLALLLMPLRTLAENYGITVAGVEVTSENATNVTGEYITAGTVSYDAQSETLTLNNVHANGQISVTRSSMTINLVGVSIFNVNTDNGKNYLIKYEGEINYGTNDPSSTLIFKADALGAVIQGIGTTDDYKLDPVDNYFALQYDMSGAWSVTYTNINNLCFCEISKPYLWVNSERLTDANKNEQLFQEVTVDLANNTVTLNNLILDNAASSWNFLIKSNLADLNVNITGGLNAFSLYAKENEDVTSRAFIYTGASGETSSLNLSIDQGSALRVSCSGKTASADWLVDGFTTSNIVTDAANAEVGQPIAKVGDPYDYQVTLVPYEPPTNYDLIVNGVQVNSDNAYDILGETAEGTLSYYASTNTLTLNGVYVRCESNFLDFSTEGLTVYLIGDNTIYCPSNDAVVFNSTVSDNTITFTTSTSNPGLLQMQSLSPFANVTPSYENGLIYDGSTDAKDIKPIKVPEIYADTSEEDIPSYSLNISDGENPTGTEYFYTIDYADASLSDVTTFTQAVYNDGDDAVDPIPLLGPCTVTVYAKYGETQSANVVGKLFGFASNTVTSQVGQAIEVPQVIPALDNDITVNISPNDQDFVAEDKDGGYIATAAGSVVFSGNLQMGTTYPDYDVLNSDGMLGEFTVNILQDPQLIFYSDEALGEVTYCEAYIGRAFTAPELRYGSDMMPVTEDFTVTYQSSNEQVATVNSQTGQVTLVGLGDVIITATSEATDVYASGTASYELRVGRVLDLRFDTNQWVTYYSDEDLTIPNGVASYIVTGVNGSRVTVETTRYIPAGVGVLLKQDGDSYADQFVAWAFTGSTAEFNYADDNLLRGVSTAAVPDEQGPIYVLYNDEFVRLTAGTSVAANHCYLPLSLPASARLSIVFDDDVPTAISAISTSGADTAEGAWYTIDGRRLSGKPVKAGLYIQNGKKVSIK